MAAWVEGRVIERIEWTPTLLSLRVEAELAPYKAGQFTKLALEQGERRVQRAYSFVNPPGTPYHEFYLVEIPGGELSPSLGSLQVGDSLLVLAKPHGPTCHNGTASCFPQAVGDVVAELDAVIAQRKVDTSESSYTRKLFDAGIARIAQKVGEEGVETALAAVTADHDALRGEAADLTYHLLVLLQARGLDWNAVRAELARRAGG